MKKTALFAAALLCAPLAFAQQVDLAQSRIGFTLKQLNVPVDGSFARFSANVVFDAKKPEAGKADLTIQTSSINLPTTDAVVEAKKKDWFNTAQYPTARFVSTGMKAIGNGRYQLSGKLTMKGITRDVSAPFTVRDAGALTLVEGTLPVSRLAFRIGEGEWSDTGTIDDKVEIKFRVALKRGA
ncbi:YceI family protein [Crenobacter luteus]|uniref:Polyisoprenoid-binding protein n=1 Tax=Crenobacter luteus TaxID=1452487 RepID=A0A165FDP4_9NEIS|nr:YceI family protein [Crenobacter luteus]KZE32922.1 polyisoprenoid-binding protein [Crenobacter luteus]